MNVLGSSRLLLTLPCVPGSVGVLPPNTDPGAPFAFATDPAGDSGLETGGVVAAKSVDEEALERNGKLANEEAGPDKSSLCLRDGIRAGKLGKACEGDVSRGASSFIDVVEANGRGFKMTARRYVTDLKLRCLSVLFLSASCWCP